MMAVVLIALQLAGSAVTVPQAKCPDLAVWRAGHPAIRGVGIGTKYTEALRRLGQPISDTVDEDGWREVLYAGLSLLVEDDGTVVNIEATESAWSLPSGVAVGSRESQVWEAYGCSKAVASAAGSIISYILPIEGSEEPSDELVWFELVDGVVVKLVLHVAHSRV